MSSQPPLNPDALANLRLLADKGTRELCHVVLEPDLLHKLLDVAAATAQPEVRTVEELDALPYGSLITGTSGVTVMKYDGPNYDWITGNDYRYRMEEQEQCLPARVLYRPAVNDA